MKIRIPKGVKKTIFVGISHRDFDRLWCLDQKNLIRKNHKVTILILLILCHKNHRIPTFSKIKLESKVNKVGRPSEIIGIYRELSRYYVFFPKFGNYCFKPPFIVNFREIMYSFNFHKKMTGGT